MVLSYSALPAFDLALLTAPDGWHFVTSDRPVVWFLPSRGYADSPAALKEPDVQLTVPLDARHAFVGFGQLPQADMRITVDDVNGRTVGYAERFVIAPDARSGSSNLERQRLRSQPCHLTRACSRQARPSRPQLMATVR